MTAFIVFEGPDGTGKTTQLEGLVQALRSEGLRVLLTHEPGGTSLGSALREILLHGERISTEAAALLFAADRAEHLERVIRPALDSETYDVVLCDRFVLSSLVYQHDHADLVLHTNGAILGGFVADLTLLFDAPDETIRARLAHRDPDTMEVSAAAVLRRANLYRHIDLSTVPGLGELRHIDASGTVEDVAAAILTAVRPLVTPGS